MAECDAKGYRVVDLKKELSKLGLAQSGVKADLIHRLASAKAQAATAASAQPTATVVDDDVDDQQHSVLDSIGVLTLPRSELQATLQSHAVEELAGLC